MNGLLQQIHRLELRHKLTLAPTDMADLIQKRAALRDLLDRRYLYQKERMKRFFYEAADKCGRPLARMLHPRAAVSYIPFIKTQKDRNTHDPGEILEVFKSYYDKLYNIKGQFADLAPTELGEKIRKYVGDTALPPLDVLLSGALEEDISETEISAAIQHTPSGKCPGPDGFTPAFYKLFGAQLAPIMARTFNSLDGEVGFVPQTLEAHISVIPKPGKDLAHAANYRPISLLNIDIKLFSKILADRLAPLLPLSIHTDQVGFVKGREARDNTIKTGLLVAKAKLESIPMGLLSIDAEKAFDRVHWGFMRAALDQLGLGPKFLQKIFALYSGPTDRVRINGMLSSSFAIQNGTRQGCPLSPLLYVIVMEHLANAIRKNEDIQGIRCGSVHHKAALYADDLLLYVSQPHTSLPSLMKELERFGHLSNFRVNFSKSEALNISLPQPEVSRIASNFPFKWKTEAVKYLGVYIPADLSKLYTLNYLTLLNRTIKNLKSYNGLRLSWFGRMNVVKMDILPRFLYIYQTVPIIPPSGFFQSLRSALVRFVWGGRRPRIGLRSLTRLKEEGGAGLPDFKTYFQASALVRMLDWTYQNKNKQWVQIEQTDIPVPLGHLPWIPESDNPVMGLAPKYTRDTLKVWHTVSSKFAPPNTLSPLSPLFSCPSFRPGYRKSAFLGWRAVEDTRVGDILVNV
ncbi:UDP-N-acetylglucosamine transporter TMEM241 isoform X1 [Anomaloglossus baeobatrachus]|uniref:UDP-N-acetylglucosamine transporter TMEM241 isoform X1 n=1 Tax=Anomaloglossus baeobatrachus TaxID=238106 RepID=UPI003F50B9FF